MALELTRRMIAHRRRTATWLALQPTNGKGTATVSFTATANPDPINSRIATLTVAGQTVQITQAASGGNGCVYTLK